MAKSRTAKLDIHQQVTDQIITCIEAGREEWQMPWHRSGEGLNRPVNIHTGNAYRGINIVALWASGQVRGFSSGTWGTYRQWQSKGAQVRKGEKSSPVIFYKEFEVEDPDCEPGETTLETRRIARASRVFNADQVDGYEQPDETERPNLVTRLERADQYVHATGAQIRYGGNRAFYRRSDDIIQMPDEDRFIGSETSTATEAFYATLLHELTHWTAAKQRCARDLGKRFGDGAYAMEELIAELGAAFLCAELDITSDPRPDHAAYIDGWLNVLKADKKAIFSAAAKAAQATDFLASLQSQDREAA